MRCTRCATELLPGKAFCHGGGLRARSSCAACGSLADPGWRFCPECGSGLLTGELSRPAEDERRLQQHIPDLERVFAEIDRVEGIVNQLAGDGLMALFGAPLTHGDDRVRAVRVAVAVQHAIAELSQRTLAERGFALRA